MGVEGAGVVVGDAIAGTAAVVEVRLGSRWRQSEGGPDWGECGGQKIGERRQQLGGWRVFLCGGAAGVVGGERFG